MVKDPNLPSSTSTAPRANSNERTPRSLISEQDPTPAYHQMRRILEEWIHEGKYAVGSRLPSENELCGMFGVSRITVRKALEQMEKASWIAREKGRGTFVRQISATRAARVIEIGVVSVVSEENVPMERDDWLARIIRAMELRLLECGAQMNHLPLLASEAAPLDRLLQRIQGMAGQLKGVLCFAPDIHGLLDELDARDIRWLTINPVRTHQTENFVSADNFEAARKLGGMMADSGCVSALAVGWGFSMSSSNGEKVFGFVNGFVDRARVHARADYLSLLESDDEESLRQLTRRLVAAPKPCGVFCVGDLLGMKVLKICQENNLAVPADVAVVAGTGLAIAEHTSPPLSVVGQPMWEMGRAAADALLKMVREGKSRIPGIRVASDFVGRESFKMS